MDADDWRNVLNVAVSTTGCDAITMMMMAVVSVEYKMQLAKCPMRQKVQLPKCIIVEKIHWAKYISV